MATITRQPFAPLDSARLQALTSTKNRQNAATQSLAAKRKASSWVDIDTENVDPNLFAKRSKAADGSTPASSLLKKPAFTLTKANLGLGTLSTNNHPVKAGGISKPRAVLKPRAPSARVDNKASISTTSIASIASIASTTSSAIRAAPLSASPDRAALGRAPRRGGILSSKRRAVSAIHRTTTTTTPSNFGAAAPFSLDAALKGTFSSFESRLSASALPSLPASFDDDGMNASWFFDIHEDTPEQEMTNLLQHSTCVLDISSDEESEQKLKRERAEGRDKENIPPPNDISQTSAARADPTDDMAIEKARNPLSQLNAADYYADGCDEASVVVVPSDELDESATDELVPAAAAAVEQPADVASTNDVEAAPQEQEQEVMPAVVEGENSVESIMTGRENPTDAALLAPIEGAGESFSLWESGSQKDDEP